MPSDCVFKVERQYRVGPHPCSFSQSERQKWYSARKTHRVAAMFGPQAKAFQQSKGYNGFWRKPSKYWMVHAPWWQEMSTAVTWRQIIFIWMLESDPDYSSFHQSTQHHVVVMSKACGTVTREGAAWRWARSALLTKAVSEEISKAGAEHN